jgi:hypothetical protein
LFILECKYLSNPQVQYDDLTKGTKPTMIFHTTYQSQLYQRLEVAKLPSCIEREENSRCGWGRALGWEEAVSNANQKWLPRSKKAER